MSSIVVSGDTSGSVTLSAPAVSGSSVLTLPVATDTLVGKATTDTLTNKTLTSPTLTTPALGTPASGILTSCTGVNYDGFKSRIINGAMVIDQRNGGAAVTINSTAETYTLDRWLAIGQSSAGVYTVDQVQDAPSGFIDSLKVTVTTQDATLGAAEYYWVQQKIEGYNAADLAWGSASAKPVTLSFWVKSSVTGTFSGSFSNSAFNYSYAYEYTINTANTWEQKTISIIGAPAGTWLTTNGIGVRIYWDLGVGTNYTGVAGSWQSAGYTGSTGSTKLIQTLNATWQITGVQLEVGSQATSFDFRSIGTDLALCQRYFQKITWTDSNLIVGQASTSSQVNAAAVYFVQEVRATPTITLPTAGTSTGNATFLNAAGSYPATIGSVATEAIRNTGFSIRCTGYTGAFVAGNASLYYGVGTPTISISAEL